MGDVAVGGGYIAGVASATRGAKASRRLAGAELAATVFASVNLALGSGLGQRVAHAGSAPACLRGPASAHRCRAWSRSTTMRVVGWRLAIHANAHALDPVRADAMRRLPGRHDGLRQIHHHASGRVQSAELRRHCAAGAHLDPDVVRAPDYVDSIELARCLRGRAPPPRSATIRTVSDVAFAFRLSPPAGLARVSFFKLDFGAPGLRLRRPALLLNRRSEDSLHHFPRERLAQLVLDRFLEHHRITRDLHHIAVEHGIVLPQEISLVQDCWSRPR